MPANETTPTVDSDDGDAHVTLTLENTANQLVVTFVDYRVTEGPNAGTWVQEGSVGLEANETKSYTTGQIFTPEDLEFRTRADLGGSVVTSDTVTLAGGTLDLPDGRSILLNRSDELLRYLPVGRAPQELGLEFEHTAMSRWNATVALRDYDRVEYDWASPITEAHIYWKHPRTGDTAYLFRGFFEQLDATLRESGTHAAGRDVMKKLTEGRASRTYTAEPTHDALHDYITTETPFSANLTEPSPVTLADDQEEQSADTTAEFDAVTSLGATDPFDTSGGQLQLAQTNFFLDSTEDMSRNGTAVDSSNSDYNAGNAEEFTDLNDSVSGSFTLGYDIPSGSVGLAVRLSSTSAPEITFRLDGGDVTTFNTGLSSVLTWHFDGSDFTDFAPGGISAGSHTLEIAQTNNDVGSVQLDAVAVYDTRYSYTFDSNVDGNGLLSGPAEGPTGGTTVEFDTINVGYNAVGARIASTWSDTSGAQQLEASNDDGGSYPLSASNTTSLDQSFATSQVGTLGRIRVTLDTYGSGRTTESPTANFNRQAVEDISVHLDGNDLSVVDDQTFSRSHFRNILDMAEFANYRVVPIYDPNRLRLDVFPKGTEATDDWVTLDSRRRVDTEGYFNRVHVEGKTPDSGPTPTATVEDADEITAVGETLTLDAGVNPQLETEADVKSKARSTLAQVTNAGGIVGEVDIMPTIVRPGYSYEVGEWTVPYGYGTDYGGNYGGGDDPPVRPLERVSWRVAGGENTELDGRLEFKFERGDIITQLRRDTDTTRDVL